MNRYIHIIYCDDVRLEVGNKQSLMGIYASELWVSDCPVMLPKICIVVNVSTPVDQPFKKLILRITKDDEVLIEAPLIGDQQQDIQQGFIENGNEQDDPDRRIAIVGTFVLSPFNIEKNSVLRVLADTEIGELKGSPLKIKIGQHPLAV
jgi:hypothetical protein